MTIRKIIVFMGFMYRVICLRYRTGMIMHVMPYISSTIKPYWHCEAQISAEYISMYIYFRAIYTRSI